MRTLAIGLVVLAACEARAPEPVSDPGLPDPLAGKEADFGETKLVGVGIERTLYEKEGDPHFFIRVRVWNPGERAVEIDLKNGWTVFYPNQWGGLEQPQRFAIDEGILEPQQTPKELTPPLHTIAPGASLVYFRKFNASGRADIDATKSPFLFISIKGQLFVRAGTRIESVLPGADCLYLRTPVTWRKVPEGAIVVSDD